MKFLFGIPTTIDLLHVVFILIDVFLLVVCARILIGECWNLTWADHYAIDEASETADSAATPCDSSLESGRFEERVFWRHEDQQSASFAWACCVRSRTGALYLRCCAVRECLLYRCHW